MLRILFLVILLISTSNATQLSHKLDLILHNADVSKIKNNINKKNEKENKKRKLACNLVFGIYANR